MRRLIAIALVGNIWVGCGGNPVPTRNPAPTTPLAHVMVPDAGVGSILALRPAKTTWVCKPKPNIKPSSVDVSISTTEKRNVSATLEAALFKWISAKTEYKDVEKVSVTLKEGKIQAAAVAELRVNYVNQPQDCQDAIRDLERDGAKDFSIVTKVYRGTIAIKAETKQGVSAEAKADIFKALKSDLALSGGAASESAAEVLVTDGVYILDTESYGVPNPSEVPKAISNGASSQTVSTEATQSPAKADVKPQASIAPPSPPPTATEPKDANPPAVVTQPKSTPKEAKAEAKPPAAQTPKVEEKKPASVAKAAEKTCGYKGAPPCAGKCEAGLESSNGKCCRMQQRSIPMSEQTSGVRNCEENFRAGLEQDLCRAEAKKANGISAVANDKKVVPHQNEAKPLKGLFTQKKKDKVDSCTATLTFTCTYQVPECG